MHKLTFAFFLVFLVLSSTVKADEKPVRYYDIETIIFESLDPAARQSENWKSDDIDRQVPKVSVELDQPYPGPIPPQFNPSLTFKTLPKSDYRLQTTEKLMVNSHQYRILLHTAWVQPGMGPDAALPVHITRSFVSQAPAANLPQPTAETQTRSVLDGYIKIILSRYLHADVDLVYTTGLPLNPQAPSESLSANTTAVNGTTPSTATTASAENASTLPPPVVYELKQSRRMRSKVLHYLDHPVLGMLVLITPHKDDAGTSAHIR